MAPTTLTRVILTSTLMSFVAFVPLGRSQARVLRVAADPNNLPFSNAQLEGFENKIVALLAQELDATVEYTWLPKQSGAFRASLRETGCDLATGISTQTAAGLTTQPYCRNGYVFLTRADRNLEIHSLDDEFLKTAQIGVALGNPDDGSPANSLSSRGMVENVHAYRTSANSGGTPLIEMIDALAKGEIDVGIVPSALGGYFLKRYAGIFTLTELSADQAAQLTQSGQLCLGVRSGDPELRDELNQVMSAKRGEIDAILTSYGVSAAD